MILKRLIGRVRPGREDAGKFLGPTFRHANYRESFPSNHTACAVALSAMLAHLYPQAAYTFWGLAADLRRRSATSSTPTGRATSSPASLVGYLVAHGTVVGFRM